MLTTGNTAKLYCLQLIDHAAARATDEFRVVDLGCGNGSNFRELLRTRRNITYVGVEPSSKSAAEARRLLPGAEIINAPAYDVRVEPADAVVSFSVLEHVVDRPRYMAAVRANLREDGRAYVNYDSGHFVADADLAERVKGVASRVLARFGSEARYRKRVRVSEVDSLLDAAGLRIVDDRMFNTDVKRLAPFIGPDDVEAFTECWLAFELQLNELLVRPQEELDTVFRTRNLLLSAAGGDRTATPGPR